jgi:hypothetical protein
MTAKDNAIMVHSTAPIRQELEMVLLAKQKADAQ